MANKDITPVKEKLDQLRQLADSGEFGDIEILLEEESTVRTLAEIGGIDIESELKEIRNAAYLNGGKRKLNWAKTLLTKKRLLPYMAETLIKYSKRALQQAQNYSTLVNDADTFYEAEELLTGLENKVNPE